MIHKLILRQARALSATIAFHYNEDTSYSWENISTCDKCALYNSVISFYSAHSGNDNWASWVSFMVHQAPDTQSRLIKHFALGIGGDYKTLYNVLMRTTACLAHLEAPAFLELFNVEFEGDEVKVTLKPDVAWDWATAEDFN